MKSILAAVLLTGAAPSAVAGQSRGGNAPLATPGGPEVGLQKALYRYEEPGFMKLVGPRTGGWVAYTLVRSGVFLRGDVRLSHGALRYQGSGARDGVPDRIWESRITVGADLRVDRKMVFSPYAGLGSRSLFNDLRGNTQEGNRTFGGYRRYSKYRYAPVGAAARLRIDGRWVLAATLEDDLFLGGSQLSKLADAVLGKTDVTTRQQIGRGHRFGLAMQRGSLTFGPWVHYWDIADSDLVAIGGGAPGYEPANWTREIGLEVKLRF